jgi:hypothetical protein
MDGAEIAPEVPDSFAPLFNQVFGVGQMPEETLQSWCSKVLTGDGCKVRSSIISVYMASHGFIALL